jgi:hypothetical protein
MTFLCLRRFRLAEHDHERGDHRDHPDGSQGDLVVLGQPWVVFRPATRGVVVTIHQSSRMAHFLHSFRASPQLANSLLSASKKAPVWRLTIYIHHPNG